MKARLKKSLSLVFFIICLLALSLNIAVVHSLDEQNPEVDVTWGTLNIDVKVFLSDNYDLWNLNIHHNVKANLTINLKEPPPTKYELSIRLLFFLENVSGLPPGANYTYGFWGYPPWHSKN